MPAAFQPFLEAFKHSKNKRGSSGGGGTSTNALSTVTGVDKSRYVNVTGTPALAFAGNADVGLTCGVSAIAAAANSKFHFEVLTTGFSASGYVNCGVFDGSQSMDSSGFLNDDPGTNSVAGISFKLALGATNVEVKRAGSSTTITVPATAVGDGIIIEGNTTSGVIDAWFYDASAASFTSLSSYTLSGAYIPAAYWPWVGTSRSTDAGSFNPGRNAFVKTPTSGYSFT